MKDYIKRCIKYLLYCLVIVGLMIALARVVTAPISINVEHADASEIKTEERDDVDRLIDQLAYCESRNNEKAINPHDPDTASYGLLQFKSATFWHYNQIYGVLPNLEAQEVSNVIFDGEIQKKLAKKIIKDGGWRNWYNCLKKYFQ